MKTPSSLRTLFTFIAITLSALVTTNAHALDVSGSIFYDTDFDGERDPGESGVQGLQIRAIDSNAQVVGIATSDSLGNYTLTGLPVGQVRVEAGLSAKPWYEPTVYGSSNASLVRFVSAGTTGVAFGITDPANHCSPSTTVAVPRMRPGSHTTTTSASILTFPEGAGSDLQGVPSTVYELPSSAPEAIAQQTGAVFGLAYSALQDTLYAGSFVKRNVDLGPTRNPTTIYAVKRSSGTVAPWITLDATRANPHSGDTDSVSPATCPHCAASTLSNGWFADFSAIGPVMKEGLGDVDISADQRTVYTVDLQTRELVAIPIKLDGTPGTPSRINILGALSSSVGVGSGLCPSLADLRPFGLGVYQGGVYVGVVCTAQSTVNEAVFPIQQGSPAGTLACPGDPAGRCAYDPTYVGPMTPILTPDPKPGDQSKLHAYVVRVDEDTLAKQKVLDFPLNYERACLFDQGDCRNSYSINWRPWIDSFPYKANVYKWWRGPDAYYGTNSIDLGMEYPQPALVDITFDEDGSMVLGIGDRFGHQAGIQFSPSPNLDGSTEYIDAAGDMLRACARGPLTWVMEKQISGDASCSTPGTSPVDSAGNSIVLDEYYFQDADRSSAFTQSNTNPGFKEALIGSVLRIPGRPSTLVTSADVAYGAVYISSLNDPNWFNTGVSTMNNTTGEWERGYIVERASATALSDLFSKGNALGDLVALCDPPPVELGDRVWFDTNRNGVQDPNELGIAGVTMSLFSPQGALIATAVTDSQGTYLFSSLNNTSNASARYSLPLQGGTAYRIVAGNTTDYASGPLRDLISTKTFQDAASLQANTLNDSNGAAASPQAPLTGANPAEAVAEIVGAGTNNHSIDFGFVTYPVVPNARCVEPKPDGTLVAYFGYTNGGPATTTIAVGADNIFLGTPTDRGQPTTFLKGTTVDAFTVTFPATDQVTWVVRGSSATANVSTSRCQGTRTNCEEIDNKPILSKIDNGARAMKVGITALTTRILAQRSNSRSIAAQARVINQQTQKVFFAQWVDVWASFEQVTNTCPSASCTTIDKIDSVNAVVRRSGELLTLTRKSASLLKKSLKTNRNAFADKTLARAESIHANVTKQATELPRFGNKCD